MYKLHASLTDVNNYDFVFLCEYFLIDVALFGFHLCVDSSESDPN